MKLSRRIVSLLMALVMLFTMVSPVFAATTTGNYTVDIVAKCGYISINKNDTGKFEQSYENLTDFDNTFGSVLGITEIDIANTHDSTRTLEGWQIYILGPRGHELLNSNVYSTADILGLKMADIVAMINDNRENPSDYQNFVEFFAVLSGVEHDYHSDVLFNPFGGSIKRNDGIVVSGMTNTGALLCEGKPIDCPISTDPNDHVGGDLGSFEGWVKLYFDMANGDNGNMVNINVDTSKVYQFNTTTNEIAGDTVPKQNVTYLAKWSNIPMREYANYGKSKTPIKVDSFGGNVEVQNGFGESAETFTDPTIYTELYEGEGFADIGFTIIDVTKTDDTFKGFYRYTPDNNGVFNINTDTDGAPVLIADINNVKVGRAPSIYVAKWESIDDNEYINYHPVLQGSSQRPVFSVRFDILYGKAEYDLTTEGIDPKETTVGGSTGEAEIHGGDTLAHEVFKSVTRTDSNGAPVNDENGDPIALEGWVIYTKGQDGQFSYHDVIGDYNDYIVQGDTVFAPKWADVDISEYQAYVPQDTSAEPPLEEKPMTFRVGFDLFGGAVNHLDHAEPVTGNKGEVVLDVEVTKGDSFSNQVGSSNFVSNGIKDDILGEFEGWLMFQVWPPMIPDGDGKFHANTGSDIENNIDYYDEDNEKFIPLTTAQVLDTYIYHEDVIWVAKWSNVADSEYLKHVTDFPSNNGGEGGGEASIKFQLSAADSITLTYADGSAKTLTQDTVIDKAAAGFDLANTSLADLGITEISCSVPEGTKARFEGWRVVGNGGKDEADFNSEEIFNHRFAGGETVIEPVFVVDVNFNFHGADLTYKRGGNTESNADSFGTPINWSKSGPTLAASGFVFTNDPEFYTDDLTFVGWNIYVEGQEDVLHAIVETEELAAVVLPADVSNFEIRAVWENSQEERTDDTSAYMAHLVIDTLDGTAVIGKIPDDPNPTGWEHPGGVAIERYLRKQGTIAQQLGHEFPADMALNGDQDAFLGWVQILRGDDDMFAVVTDEEGDLLVIPNATVKGSVLNKETYYVAFWAGMDLEDYEAYAEMLNNDQGGGGDGGEGEHPDDGEEGGEILDTTNGFWVGFDLFGGTAMHFPKGIEEEGGVAEKLGPSQLGYAVVRTQIANDTVFSSVHGEEFIYDPAFNGDEEAFLGWLAFADVDADGNEDGEYKFVGDSLDEVYTTEQVLGMKYDEANIIWVAKWDGVNELSYAGYATRMSDNGGSVTITFELGNATSVDIAVGEEGAIELGSDASVFKTSDEAYKTLADLGVTGLSSEINTDRYHRPVSWVVFANDEPIEFENADALINQFELPEGEVVIRPLYYGAFITVEFLGAEVIVTSGDLIDTPKDRIEFLFEFNKNGNSLEERGYDSISDPVFYTEREFLGWNVYVLTDPEVGFNEQPENSEPIDSEHIVSYVIPKDAIEVRYEAVWADSTEQYIVSVAFDVIDGTAIVGREYDEDGNIVGGNPETGMVFQSDSVKKNATLEDQLGLAYPVEMSKEGAEFEGWLRFIVADDEVVIDETVVTDEVVRKTTPTENVCYVAKWSDRDMAYYRGYLSLQLAEEFGYWMIIGNGGSVEISGDIGNTHRAEVASGYVPVDINIADGMFANDSYEIYNSGSVALNAFREQHSLVGWNVYKEDGSRTYTLVPQGQEPEIPDGDIFMYYGRTGMIDPETEEMVMYDEYVVFSGCTSLVSGISTEDLFKLPMNESLILIPVWEEVEPDNVDIPESDEEHAVHVQQGVVEVPEIPADPNDPNSEPMYESMEQVKEALEDAIAEVVDRDVSGREKTVFMEIKLMVKQENPVTQQEEWVEVTDPNVIPPEGIEVIIPFPELAGKSGFKYVITHLNSKTGEIEVYDEDDYEITDKGLKIRVTSLSPFAVYYEEITSGGQGDVTITPTTPGESAPGRQNPNTGVHF